MRVNWGDIDGIGASTVNFAIVQKLGVAHLVSFSFVPPPVDKESTEPMRATQITRHVLSKYAAATVVEALSEDPAVMKLVEEIRASKRDPSGEIVAS